MRRRHRTARSHRTRPRLLVWALLFAAALALPLTNLTPPASAAAPAARSAGDRAKAGPDGDDPHAPVHGLKGEYFRMSEPGARDFAELGGTALDPRIEFDDLTSTFQELTGRTENTTARWTGELTAPKSGTYTFWAKGDNGFRFFLDGKPVIDHWVGDWDVEQHSEPVTLEAGEHHDVRFEMFQDTGGANMHLSWSSDGTEKQPVPESAFTPPSDWELFPVVLSVPKGGRQLRATFDNDVRHLDAVPGHLTVKADTTPMPIASLRPSADDPHVLLVDLKEPIQQDQRVRFSYDGEGGLTVGDESVPQILRDADNRSTHRLRTEWGEHVDPEHPLPEYPRPQQKRDRWRNLNGPWQFAGATEGEQPPFGKQLDERITVPFPVESQLSGIERHEDHMFYRRLVTVPKQWAVGRHERLKLHFGAVDQHARVWVNGHQVAEHTGGYTGFSADVTDALEPGGKQEIVVAVTDTTGPNQPRGKQSTKPGGIFYTQSSGIWQTVWMEPVPEASVDDLTTTPDIDAHALTVNVGSQHASSAARVTAVARDAKGRKVGSVTGPVGRDLRLPVEDQHLWSPDDPYLYDLEVRLTDGSSTDRVDSYFGMRSLGVQDVGGHRKIVLNGKPFFSLAMLDQGFWPDGLYTAPSDEALAFDLKAQKELGFNAVRKHIKVEPPRWYYHADKLGLLVWQDFVSADITNEQGQDAWLSQGRAMMKQLHNSPAVGGWVVFNEGWGEWDREATGRIAESVKKADPSRLVDAHSGVNCCDSKGDSGKGDIIDHHDYNNDDPAHPDETRAAMDGEHGGFTLRTPGHMWPGAPTVIYSGVADKEALTEKYVENTRKYYLGRASGDLSGSVYTQVTDLENELNGMLTYDRRQFKVAPDRVREINRKVIAAGTSAH